MFFKSKYLSLPLMLVLLASLQRSEACDHFCYSHSTDRGQFDICYNECKDTSQASFASCWFKSASTNELKELSETQCLKYYYPEMLQQVQNFREVQQKMDQKQKEKALEWPNVQIQDQRDTYDQESILTMIAIGLVSGITAILTIILIAKYLDSQQSQKEKLQSNQTQDYQKDISDINMGDSQIHESIRDLKQNQNQPL